MKDISLPLNIDIDSLSTHSLENIQKFHFNSFEKSFTSSNQSSQSSLTPHTTNDQQPNRDVCHSSKTVLLSYLNIIIVIYYIILYILL